jgi:glycosyltransferase A (GT-A) superfamily protein (DUF2064 family)
MRKMAPRVLVLFGRAPRREARGKGLAGAAGERLFATFAKGWIDAANGCGARVVVATPSDERPAWRRALPGARFEFLEQRGATLGSRLEDAARRVAGNGGTVVLVGGDVAPCARSLEAAFEHREQTADAAVSPAPDGGVSLVSLRDEDLDLLGRFVPRRSDVFVRLARALALRHRRIALVAPAGDVDGRRELGRLLRARAFRSSELEALARVALAESRFAPIGFVPRPASVFVVDLDASRAPPRVA